MLLDGYVAWLVCRERNRDQRREADRPAAARAACVGRAPEEATVPVSSAGLAWVLPGCVGARPGATLWWSPPNCPSLEPPIRIDPLMRCA
jgi:hypothetical protein